MTRSTPLLIFALLAWAGPVWAQAKALLTVPETKARLLTALTSGPKPLRPELTRGEVDRMSVEERADPLHGPTYELTLRSDGGACPPNK